MHPRYTRRELKEANAFNGPAALILRSSQRGCSVGTVPASKLKEITFQVVKHNQQRQ
jgi:hypothetical protein